MHELLEVGESTRPEWDESSMRQGSWKHDAKAVAQAILTVHDKSTLAALKGK